MEKHKDVEAQQPGDPGPLAETCHHSRKADQVDQARHQGREVQQPFQPWMAPGRPSPPQPGDKQDGALPAEPIGFVLSLTSDAEDDAGNWSNEP